MSVSSNVIDMMQFNPETWEEAISMGIHLREQGDIQGSWNLGWLTDVVCRHATHGDHTLTLFARAIGESISALRRKRWVASGFTIEQVRMFPSLSFSHFTVVRSLMEEDPEEALSLLEQAEQEQWSVEHLRRMARNEPPAKFPALRIDGQISALHLRAMTVQVGDEAMTVYLAAPVRRDGRAITDVIEHLARMLTVGEKAASTVRWSDQKRTEFQLGIHVLSAGDLDWNRFLEDHGMNDAFVRAVFSLAPPSPA